MSAAIDRNRESQTDATAAVHLGARESQLATVVEAYLAALEAGQEPDRAEFLARHPELAEDLARCLEGLELVHRVSAQLSSAALSRSIVVCDPMTAAATLGDFRIVREIGRGGMGVVYEAEQLSIGRRVALKVLPFAAMLDRQQLNRFKNEARAAGTLDHPNIVAVYSVGVERGVHYYAMQLIEGQSLAQVVEQLRAESKERRVGTEIQDCSAPLHGNRAVDRCAAMAEGLVSSPPLHGEGCRDTVAAAALTTACAPHSSLLAPSSTLPAFSSREYFRTVAQLGIQAAEALDHAHQNGILHRDIKPANLLLECQTPSSLRGGLGRGCGDASHFKLWITDFGLARLEADAGMTMTGDILGTLRYMSPEQALGKRVVVDHRSDIYSLGVTLYELLTLQPAFTASDRQELLRQIAFDEPRKPRQITSQIPKDLETVVLKAIEKEPSDRYTTAVDMRNDLVAYVENRPVSARPASLLLRARKMFRRHRSVVIATAATLLVALALGAVGSFIAFGRERVQRQAAQRHLELAREAVDEMFTKVATTWVPESATTTELQRQFLDRALAIYQQLALEPPDGDPRGEDAAQAHERIADIHAHVGDLPAAVNAWRTAIEIYKELNARDDAAVSSEALVRCYRKLANAQAEELRRDEAIALTDVGIELAKPLVEKHIASPDLQMELARLLYEKAKLLAGTDRLADAHDAITEAEDVVAVHANGSKTVSKEVAGVQTESSGVSADEFELFLRLVNVRTSVLCRQGKFDEAAEFCRENKNCMRVVESAFFDSKPMLDLRADFAENEAQVLLAQGNVHGAVYELRSALKIRAERLGGRSAMQCRGVSRRNFDPFAVAEYCDTQLHLAAQLPALDLPYEAECMLGEALYMAEYLNDQFGALVPFAVLYANASARVGEWLAEKRPAEAEHFFQLAASAWNDTRKRFPASERFHSGLGGDSPDWEWFRRVYPNYSSRTDTREWLAIPRRQTAFRQQLLGRAAYQSSQWLAATRHFSSAINRFGSNQTSDRLHLAMAFAQRGEMEKAMAEYETAIAQMNKLLTPDAELESLRRSANLLLTASTSTTSKLPIETPSK